MYVDGKYAFIRNVDDLSKVRPGRLIVCDNEAFIANNRYGFNSTFNFIFGDGQAGLGWQVYPNSTYR